jgi:protein-tyrosine phosphatase
VTSVISNGSNVLVHCSDGWDRTAQVTSLAQVCKLLLKLWGNTSECFAC